MNTSLRQHDGLIRKRINVGPVVLGIDFRDDEGRAFRVPADTGLPAYDGDTRAIWAPPATEGGRDELIGFFFRLRAAHGGSWFDVIVAAPMHWSWRLVKSNRGAA